MLLLQSSGYWFENYYLTMRFSLFVKMGFAPEVQVEGARESDRSKEKNGFVAGKHINKESKWWFQRSKKDWTA